MIGNKINFLQVSKPL